MRKTISILTLSFAIISCNNSSTNYSDRHTGHPETPAATIINLPSPADSIAAEPWLFSDKNGEVYLSWIHKSSDSGILKFSVLGKEEWSVPKTIASGKNWFINWADYPVLASDGEGNLVAHFLEKSDSGKFTYDIKITSSQNEGNAWSTPLPLHDDRLKAEHGFVSMMPYQDGYFISWLDGRNTVMPEGSGNHEGHHGQMTLRGAIVDKGGNKTNEWELDERVCDCCQTSSAITSNGPVLIYRDRSADEIRDISIVRMVGGKWTSPQTIHADNWKITGCPVNGPRIDAAGNNLAIAWFSSPEKNPQVNVIFSKDGGASFGKPVRMDEGNATGRVDLVMLDDQCAFVSWMEGSAIKAAKVFSNGKKEPSILIAASSESRSAGFPQMTKTENGLVFAWTDPTVKTIRTIKLPLK